MTTLGSELGLIPPRRLGRLMADLRTRRDESPGHLVGSIIDEFGAAAQTLTVERLETIEGGRVMPTDDEVTWLGAALGFAVGRLTPDRVHLVVDRSEGQVVHHPGERARGYVAPLADRRTVMIRYLALVYSLRGMKPGRFLVPRANDLAILGEVLGQTADALRRELERLMMRARPELVTLRDAMCSRAVVPEVGVLVAVTATGSLLFHPVASGRLNPYLGFLEDEPDNAADAVDLEPSLATRDAARLVRRTT